MYSRSCKPLLSQSFFLFGARGTGKSTLLKQHLSEKKTHVVDLLDDQLAQSLMANPNDFEKQILALPDLTETWVVVDEVQRVPGLLNYVHRLIESHQIKFALTGSSARKLKRGGANLLAGRAFVNSLYPLTHIELGDDFKIDFILNWGSLPLTINLKTDQERSEYLKSYVAQYIKEEIKEEQLIRKVEPFLHFLETSAQCNGTILNFSKIGRDSGNNPSAVERYYEILKDTLLGFNLQPYDPSIRKRQFQKSKFFWFDLGVKKALDRTLSVNLTESTYAYGKAFEHFFIAECVRLNEYLKKDFRFSYLRTKDDVEIDLIVERPARSTLLIEIKSAKRVDEKEFGNVIKLKTDIPNSELIIASRETQARQFKDFRILPWREVIRLCFLEE